MSVDPQRPLPTPEWTQSRRASSEGERWFAFGRWLAGQRSARGLRVREAAKRARMPEAEWRTLEAGVREYGGVRVLPNPGPEVLGRVAEALEIPTGEVLEQVRLPVLQAIDPAPDEDSLRLAQRLAQLAPGDRRLVEGFIERLLRGPVHRDPSEP